jgi:hypothetical protein
VHYLHDSKNGFKYTMNNKEMYATWQFSDVESGILEYRCVESGGHMAERSWV